MNYKSGFLFAALLTSALLGNAQDRARSEAAKARAQEIVRQMSLDEKIAQVHGISDSIHYRFGSAGHSGARGDERAGGSGSGSDAV